MMPDMSQQQPGPYTRPPPPFDPKDPASATVQSYPAQGQQQPVYYHVQQPDGTWTYQVQYPAPAPPGAVYQGQQPPLQQQTPPIYYQPSTASDVRSPSTLTPQPPSEAYGTPVTAPQELYSPQSPPPQAASPNTVQGSSPPQGTQAEGQNPQNPPAAHDGSKGQGQPPASG